MVINFRETRRLMTSPVLVPLRFAFAGAKVGKGVILGVRAGQLLVKIGAVQELVERRDPE